jgi:hypothetical protein
MLCYVMFGCKGSTSCASSCVSLWSGLQSEAVIVLMMCIRMLWLHCIVEVRVGYVFGGVVAWPVLGVHLWGVLWRCG